MALIDCPECGKRFSDFAPACPDCGMPTDRILLREKEPDASSPAPAPAESAAPESAAESAAAEQARPAIRQIRRLEPTADRLEPHLGTGPRELRSTAETPELRSGTGPRELRPLSAPRDLPPRQDAPNPWHRNEQTSAPDASQSVGAAVRPAAPQQAAAPAARPSAPAAQQPAGGGRTHPPAPVPNAQTIESLSLSLPSTRRSGGGGAAGPVLAILFTVLAALCVFHRELFGGVEALVSPAPWLRLAGAVFFLAALVFVTLGFARCDSKALPAVACILLVLFAAAFVYFRQPFKGLFNETEQPRPAQTENAPEPSPAGTESAPASSVTVTPAADAEQSAEATELRLGDTLTLDFVKMTLDSFELSDGYDFVYRDGPEGGGSVTYKTSIECPDGMRLIALRGSFTNLLNKEVTVMSNGPVKGLLIVNGSEYSTKLRCLNTAKADNLWNVASKQTVDYFLYAEVPEEVANDIRSCRLRIAFNEEMDNARWVPDFDKYPYQFVMEAMPGPALEARQSDAPERVLPLSLGTTVSTDEYDLTIDNVEFLYELKPRNTTGVYTSYTAERGKIYLHIDGTFYNSSRKDYHVRDLPIAKLDFNDGYTYDGFALVDRNDNSFDWVSSYVICTPLNSCHYHCLIECPESIAESSAPLFITMQIGDDLYRYDIR